VGRCVVHRLVRRLISRLVAMFVWFLLKNNFSQSQIQSMIWTSTLQIRKHEYSGDLDFIILILVILPLYAINLGVVSLFAHSPFTFLAMLSCYYIWCIL